MRDGTEIVRAEAGPGHGDRDTPIHGATRATNALTARCGVRVALVTTDGFRDGIGMRTESRFDPHDLNLRLAQPPVLREDRFPVRGRVCAQGRERGRRAPGLRPPTSFSWRRTGRRIPRLRCRSRCADRQARAPDQGRTRDDRRGELGAEPVPASRRRAGRDPAVPRDGPADCRPGGGQPPQGPPLRPTDGDAGRRGPGQPAGAVRGLPRKTPVTSPPSRPSSPCRTGWRRSPASGRARNSTRRGADGRAIPPRGPGWRPAPPASVRRQARPCSPCRPRSRPGGRRGRSGRRPQRRRGSRSRCRRA